MNKKIRILALDQGEHLGGAERFFNELLVRLPQQYEVHLLTGTNKKYMELYKQSNVQLHSTALPALKPIGLKTVKNKKKSQQEIRKLIKTIQPDVIVSNTIRTHILVSALAKEAQIPLLWMAHDRTFPKILLRWYGRYPQKILCCSQFVADYYQKNTSSINATFAIMYPFGIEQSLLQELHATAKENIIGMVGKFIPWKGQELFIRCAKKIHQHHPEYRFVIIGDPYLGNQESEEYFKKCSTLVKELQLEGILEITSSQSAVQEMAKWKLLVHCSQEPEPLGRVVLEGMAANCLVIASTLGGAPEVIGDDRGLLSEPSENALYKALIIGIEQHDLSSQYTNNAAKYISQEFSWSQVIKRWQNFLTSS